MLQRFVRSIVRTAPRPYLIEEVLEIGKGAGRREREPVPHRLADAGLVLHVVREVRERIALALPGLVVDLLVAPREGDGLEGDGVDLVDVPDSEPQDVADLVVVDRVHDRRDQGDVDPRRVEVVERPELDVVQVADAAVRVRLVSDPVELKVREPQPRVVGCFREVRLLREPDAVRRALDGEVADLLRVARRLEEMGRDRRLAARELHGELAPRLDRRRVVEDLPDVLEGELVDVTDLVRVHEARVAHHVAAVREVDRENCAAAVLDRGRAVLVKRVLRDPDVAPEEVLLEPAEELRVTGHQIFERPVLRARLDHPDLVASEDDVGRNFSGPPVHELAELARAAYDGVAHLSRARRAQRIRAAGVAQGRLRALVTLRERLGRPGRMKSTRRDAAIHGLKGIPGDVRRRPYRLVELLAHRSPPEYVVGPGSGYGLRRDA